MVKLKRPELSEILAKLRILCILVFVFLPFQFDIDFARVTREGNPERFLFKAIANDHRAITALLRSSTTEEAAYWHSVVHKNVVFPVVSAYVNSLQQQGLNQASYWVMLAWINQSTTLGRKVNTTELNAIAATFRHSPHKLRDWLTTYPDSFDGRLWKAYFQEVASLSEITQTSWLPIHYQKDLLHEVSYLTVPPKNLNATDCLVTVLPVVYSWRSLSKLRSFYALLTQSGFKNDTGLCFHQAVIEPLDRLCRQNQDEQIKCELSRFESLQGGNKNITQLLVITDGGRANTQLGVSYVSAEDTSKTVLHEFLHLFNFVDEYALEPAVQRRFCNINAMQILGSNVVGIKRDISLPQVVNALRSIQEAGYKLGRWKMFLGALIPVYTCQGQPATVFRIAASSRASGTLMQYADGSIPKLYWMKLTEELQLRRGLLNYYSQAVEKELTSTYVDWHAISLEWNAASNYFAADMLFANGKYKQAMQLLNTSSSKGFGLAQMLLAIELLKQGTDDTKEDALRLVEQAVLNGEYLAIELYVSLLRDLNNTQQASLWEGLLLAAQ